MRLLKQSSTAQPLVFLMVDSTDHITGKTGLSPTVTIRKSNASAAGSFGSPAGTVRELGSGWYQIDGNATDTNTLGPLILHATGTGADPVDVEYAVVAFDPQDAVRMGQTALPNAAAEASGGLPTLSAAQGSNGTINVNVHRWLTGTPLALSSQQVQAIVPDTQKVDVNTIKTQTVTLSGGVTIPAATLASTTNITAGTIATVTNPVTVDTVNDKTGYSLSVSGIADIADGVWDEGSGGHTTGGTYGALVSDIWIGQIAAIGTVDSTGATASSFRSDLTAVDDAYNDMLLTFTSGALSGQTKPIASYVQTNGVFTFDEAFTAAPANGVTFQVVKTHVHPISQIATGVWSSATRTLTAIDEDSTTLDLDATVRSAVGLASANLDTQLDALPTAAENTTAVWGAAARTLTALDEDSTTLDLDATIRAAVGLASANLDTQIDALPTTAEVRTQCDDALVAINLDHLVKSAVDTNFATTVHLDSVIGQLADNGTTATFDRTTDSQEAIRDRGDAAWTTATGFSTLDAAGVRTAVGLASANLDTQFSNLDGKVSIIQAVAEQLDDTLVDQGGGVYGFTAAALQAGDDATLAAITALNDLSAADVWNAATRTLTALDEDSTTLDLDATIRGAVGMASANLDTQLSTIDTVVDSILADTGTDGVVLSSSTMNSIATALLDLSNGVETSFTLRQALRLILSSAAGELAGAASSSITIRDINDTKARITATVDADGNRTALTYDVT